MKFYNLKILFFPFLTVALSFNIDAKVAGYRVFASASGNKLHIEIENSSPNNSDICIYDSEMHALESYHIEGQQNKLTVNSEEWPSGIYFIIISQRITQQTILQKVNINHVAD